MLKRVGWSVVRTIKNHYLYPLYFFFLSFFLSFLHFLCFCLLFKNASSATIFSMLLYTMLIFCFPHNLVLYKQGDCFYKNSLGVVKIVRVLFSELIRLQ